VGESAAGCEGGFKLASAPIFLDGQARSVVRRCHGREEGPLQLEEEI
jgi:hypothetical protein